MSDEQFLPAHVNKLALQLDEMRRQHRFPGHVVVRKDEGPGRSTGWRVAIEVSVPAEMGGLTPPE